MASPFQPLQDPRVFAPMSGIPEAGANIGNMYAKGLSSFGQSIAEGLQEYNKNSALNDNADQRAKALHDKIFNLQNMIGDDPELKPVGDSLVPTVESLSKFSTLSLPRKLAALNEAEATVSGIGDNFKLNDYIWGKKVNREIADAPDVVGTSTEITNAAQADMSAIQWDLTKSPEENEKNTRDYYRSIKSKYGVSAKLDPEDVFVRKIRDQTLQQTATLQNPQLKAFWADKLFKMNFADDAKAKQARGEGLTPVELDAIKNSDSYAQSVFKFTPPTGSTPASAVTPVQASAPVVASAPVAQTQLAPTKVVQVPQPTVVPQKVAPVPASATPAPVSAPAIPVPKKLPEASDAEVSAQQGVPKGLPANLSANSKLVIKNYNESVAIKAKESIVPVDSGKTISVGDLNAKYGNRIFSLYDASNVLGVSLTELEKLNPNINVNGVLSNRPDGSQSIEPFSIDVRKADKQGNLVTNAIPNPKLSNLQIKIPVPNPEASKVAPEITSIEQLPEEWKAKFEKQNGKGSIQKIIDSSKGSNSSTPDGLNNPYYYDVSQPVSRSSGFSLIPNAMADEIPVGSLPPAKTDETKMSVPTGLPAPTAKPESKGLLDSDSLEKAHLSEAKVSSHYYGKAADAQIAKLKLIRDEVNNGKFDSLNPINLGRWGDVTERMNPDEATAADAIIDSVVTAAQWYAGGKIGNWLGERNVSKEMAKTVGTEVDSVLSKATKEMTALKGVEKSVEQRQKIATIASKTAEALEKKGAELFGKGSKDYNDWLNYYGITASAAGVTMNSIANGDVTVFGVNLNTGEGAREWHKYGKPYLNEDLDPKKAEEINNAMRSAYQGISDANVDTEGKGLFGWFYNGEKPTSSQLYKVKTALDTSINKLEGIKQKNIDEWNGLTQQKGLPFGTAKTPASANQAIEQLNMGEPVTFGTVTSSQPRSSEDMKQATRNYIKSLHGFVPSGFDSAYKLAHPEDDLKFSETPYGTAMWTNGKWEMIKGAPVRSMTEQAQDAAVTFGTPDGKGGIEPVALTMGSDYKVAGIFHGSVQAASTFREEYPRLLRAKQTIDELQTINDMPAESLNMYLRGQGAEKVGRLIAQLRKELIGVGTVSDYEQQLLQSLVPDPTAIFNVESTVRAKYDELKNGVEQHLLDYPTSFGLSVIKTGRNKEYEKKVRDQNQLARKKLGAQQ